MARGEALSPHLRSQICELRSIGYTYGQIQHIKRPTIISTCKREASRVNNMSKPRKGAPRKLSDEQRDHLYDTVTHENPHLNNRDLLREVNDAVKLRTLQLILHAMDKKKWRQRKRPEIKPHHAAAHLEWAEKYKDYTPDD